MKWLIVCLASITLMLSAAFVAQASRIEFSSSGSLDAGYTPEGGTPVTLISSIEDGQESAFASDGIENMHNFSITRTNGLNDVGASTGTIVNNYPYVTPNTEAAAKTDIHASLTATATARNKYYFSTGGDGVFYPIIMDFLYDGTLQGVMEGLDLSNMADAEGYISYSVTASAWAEGFWSYDTNWSWSFNESNQYDLTALYDGDDNITDFIWQNEDGDILGNPEEIGGKETMYSGSFMKLTNAVYFVDYSISVEVNFSGLALQEGGYLYLKSDFYNSLSATVLTTDTVSDEPFPEDNPIPEPATMLLFGSGLAGLAGLRLRRRRR